MVGLLWLCLRCGFLVEFALGERFVLADSLRWLAYSRVWLLVVVILLLEDVVWLFEF